MPQGLFFINSLRLSDSSAYGQIGTMTDGVMEYCNAGSVHFWSVSLLQQSRQIANSTAQW